jgi:hypothetical protein
MKMKKKKKKADLQTDEGRWERDWAKETVLQVLSDKNKRTEEEV